MDGGDHNLYFPGDRHPIRRSSHSLMPDEGDAGEDLGDIDAVYEWLRDQPALIIPHVGGRTADLSRHDPALEPLIEIHSSHATSEWFFREALARGYRVGVVAGSDGIMGRPGACAPGNHVGRNTRGGLTAVYASELSRTALWEALRARRCYATTGPRILLSVAADGHAMGEAYETTTAPEIVVDVTGVGELESVELFRGLDVIHSPHLIEWGRTRPGFMRISWSGARDRGSAIQARLAWDGELALDRGRILAVAGYALESPAERVWQPDERRVSWQSVTAGDRDGLIVQFAAPDDAIFHFAAPFISFPFSPADLEPGPKIFEAGPLARRVTISRLPAEPGPKTLRYSYVDDAVRPGVHPYYVRVTQWDGEMAWSSPIFVRYTA